ncbi:benzoate/H(+) symporter BenE family transporter [Micromonospora wenchangensis]|uniref:benzoate/H(+) symporter BenE family transporter n=1 Tax=Micromonospora wenchangensis TaxID=1185415 RepID=UPI00342430EC
MRGALPALAPPAPATAVLPAPASTATAPPVVPDPRSREAAVVTFVVTASGVSLLGVGGAFWGLLAGWLMLLLFRRRRPVPAG